MLSRPCSLVLKSLGWTLKIDWPASRKYVLVVYPHTSNWDFLLGVCAAKAIRLDAHYIGKHTLFRKPYGWFFRSLGGIPVDRRRKASLAQQLAERFDEADDFILGLAPEGTRSKTDHWKSGFYHIARAAKVPIAMAYLDYGHKEVGMGGEFMPGKDIDEVYDRIRSFFEGRLGKHPEKASTIDRRRDVQERRAGAT
jgi:1-acyl-sn-glycerol-3-phosphate acyltransferase